MTYMKSVMESIDERLRNLGDYGASQTMSTEVDSDKVSGWGDHYQLVAQRSVLKRAISKPVLAKRGLVSCLDYYLKRHALKVS